MSYSGAMGYKFLALICFFLMGVSLPVKAISFAPYNSSFFLEVTKEGGATFACSSVAINPKTLITAAHCLEGAQEIKVSEGSLGGLKRQAISWNIHPDYDKGESNYYADLGVITLNLPLPYTVNFPVLSKPLMGYNLIRIGFGARKGKNNRTYISGIQCLEEKERTLILKDKLGVPGDSGGPVYQFQNGRLTLVAIHSTVEGQKSFAPIVLNFLK